MSRRSVVGLVLIGVAILVLLLNTRTSATIDFWLFQVRMMQSLAFLFFLGTGVFIGALLR